MKSLNRIIMTMLVLVSLQMSTAFASINYLEDADSASKDINNILTMYLGMPERDFIHNFSDVKEWKTHERAAHPEKENTYVYHLDKGSVQGNILEGISVEFKNGCLKHIQWSFYTSNEQIKKMIYARIGNNIEKNAAAVSTVHNRYSNGETATWDVGDISITVEADKIPDNDFPWKELYIINFKVHENLNLIYTLS